MNARTQLFRRIRIVTVTVLSILLVPYLFSRLASSSRCVSVHIDRELNVKDSASESLRICTYNIAHGRGLAESNWEGGTAAERRKRLDRIAELLRTLDADVVVLNEVDFDSSWSDSENQAAVLARQAGYKFRAEQRNLDFRVLTWKWRFGNAILSKYPIKESHLLDLPGFSMIESVFAGSKRALSCVIDVNGRQVRVIAVHLCHRSEAVRAESADVLRDAVASNSVSTVVAGDFNSSPAGFPNSESDPVRGNAMDKLDASRLFARRPESEPASPADLTYHSAQPTSTIDWILVPRDIQILSYRAESSVLSDHRPVIAEILLNSTQQPSMPESTER